MMRSWYSVLELHTPLLCKMCIRDRYWASVKICIRNGYTISDGSMWRDTIDLLRHFGKDTNSPKYVCPADLEAEHDKLVIKRNRQRERERTEEQRRKAVEDEKNYLKAKGMFFGLVFSDNLILVKVIESVEEMIEEGDVYKRQI